VNGVRKEPLVIVFDDGKRLLETMAVFCRNSSCTAVYGRSSLTWVLALVNAKDGGYGEQDFAVIWHGAEISDIGKEYRMRHTEIDCDSIDNSRLIMINPLCMHKVMQIASMHNVKMWTDMHALRKYRPHLH
jgi:hypothetical protein